MGGGGGVSLWGPHFPVVGFFTSVPCGPMSPRPPPVRRPFGPRLLAFFLWRVGMLCSWLLFFFFHRSSPVPSPGTSVCPLSLLHVPWPPPRCPRPFPLVGVGVGGGGGGRPRCPSSGVSTSQARWRGTSPSAGEWGLPRGPRRRPSHSVFAPPVPPPLGLARRVLPPGTVVWSVPHPLPAASPFCRFVLGRRAAVRPSLPSSPTLGGAEVCVWGGGGACRLPFVAHMSQARRKHGAGTRRGTRPSAGGRGHALRLPSSPFLPCARTPGRPPAGACTARALLGHGRVVRPAPSYRCLPTLPRCPRGGGRFSPPPYPHFPPSGGRGWVGGGGVPMSSPLRCTHVAGMTQARHKHGVRHLAAAGGGGVPFGPSRPSPWYRLRTPGSPAAVAPRR